MKGAPTALRYRFRGPDPLDRADANWRQSTMTMACKDVIIRNKLGLHARPAMQFVDVANRFRCSVRVESSGEEPAEADGKSVMQMIILAATEGTPLRIVADGEDAREAVEKLAALVDERFGEE